MRVITIAQSQFITSPRTRDPRQQSTPAAPRFNRRFVAASFFLATPTVACIAPAAAADIRSQQQSMSTRQDILNSSSSLEHSPRQDKTESSTAEEPMLIAGSWRKDKDLSDMEGYGKQLDLLGIGGVKKKAATILMDGVDIKQDLKGFTTSFVTKVRFFRPVESFCFGKPMQMARRDQRKGSQTAVVAPVSQKRIEVDVTWEDPMQGGFKEVYTIPEPGVLHIHSVTTVGDKSESTLQVYRKRD